MKTTKTVELKFKLLSLLIKLFRAATVEKTMEQAKAKAMDILTKQIGMSADTANDYITKAIERV